MMKLEFPGIVGSGELYLRVMKAICGDTQGKSMVDLMCYHAPYTPLLGFSKRTYVDIQDRGLDHKEEQEYFVKSDVFDYLMNTERPFDVAICSDGLEHLSRDRGVDLLVLMMDCSENSIIFTPLGEYMVTNDDHPDSHKSGWMPEDFRDGWGCIVFPDFHPALNTGAFFAWHCENIEQDFERVKNELNDKLWTI
jgi:hypothetical protein